jgi:hypothetical protein
MEESLAVQETLAYFGQLGALVEQRWAASGRSAAHLAEVATGALCEVPVPDSISPSSVLDLLVDGSALPKQLPPSDRFGQPPVVMYKAENFEIQALVWMEGTTSVHQHGFDGAFRVLCGSSLHVPYGFSCGDTLAEGHLIVGDLTMGEPEILWPGDVRPIISGGDFIHALFHLERPSVTIVVRNNSSNLPYPQYSYRLPGVGFDELDTDNRLLMRLRGLGALHLVDPEMATEAAIDVVKSQDLWQAFRLCDYWAYNFGSGPELAALTEILGSRAAPLAQVMDPMYAEELRVARLLSRRGMMREARHRLFLALIVNLPNRAAIHTAVEQLFPDQDGDRVVLEWVSELASPKFRGVSGLNLGADELELLQKRLLEGETDGALDLVSSLWRPPLLVEKLFA